MRVSIDDTFATKTYTVPIFSGWISSEDSVTVSLVEYLAAPDVAADDVALIPSSELRILQASHEVVADVAVIADGVGAIAMRTPVRPDEIDTTPVRLLDTGGAAEMLARATLRPFYGIETTNWIRDDRAPNAARAEVVIVEGAEALREPEGGFSEDLCRAWFILTAQPVVSHVLLAPRDMDEHARRDVVAWFETARAAGLERRREWRMPLADSLDVGRDRASSFWAAQRFKLEAADRRALLHVLAKGSRGTSSASPWNVRFVEGVGTG